MGWQPTHGRSGYQHQFFRRRARAASRRYQWRRALRWIKVLLPILIIIALGFFSVVSKPQPWPAMITLKHLAAAPNCDAARAVGLAPARRGQPGYYPQHDRDRDGIACEPWPR